MSIEFEVKGNTYRAGKLDCFAQLHVSRKLAPMLPKLFPVLGLFAGRSGEEIKAMAEDMSVVAELVGPLANALAVMPKDDVDLIVTACLSVVTRQQGQTWSRVWRDGSMMFSDIELDTMLPIVVRVVRDSLGNFIAGFLSPKAATELAAAG